MNITILKVESTLVRVEERNKTLDDEVRQLKEELLAKENISKEVQTSYLQVSVRGNINKKNGLIIRELEVISDIHVRILDSFEICGALQIFMMTSEISKLSYDVSKRLT